MTQAFAETDQSATESPARCAPFASYCVCVYWAEWSRDLDYIAYTPDDANSHARDLCELGCTGLRIITISGGDHGLAADMLDDMLRNSDAPVGPKALERIRAAHGCDSITITKGKV